MAPSSTLTAAIRQLLSEGFHGRSSGSTWFLDEDGLLATARRLDASQASRAPIPGSASIAAHVEHVRWFVALLNAFARGEQPDIRWSDSWSVDRVEDAEWARLLDRLEAESEELLQHVERGVDVEDEERLLPLLATVTHVAYHVGALRQMVRALDKL